MDTEEPRIEERDDRKVDGFWDDPQNIMALIDLIFLADESRKDIRS